MCGRFLLDTDIEDILEHYRIFKGWTGGSNPIQPEIFPSTSVPVVVNKGTRELISLKWGFAPSFSKSLIINSRAETIDSKPMFRRAFRQKRCIVPANAFFEWKREGKIAIKHKIYLKQQSIFSMAGIYDDYIDKNGNKITAFSIITTEPNPLVAQIHNRMPVILPRECEELWLDPGIGDEQILKSLLNPYDANEMVMERA